MSEWYQIESNSLIVQVTSKGAEMKRLFSKKWHRELLWLGEEKVWNRTAPILFPIVGKLKDDEYNLNGKKYKMPQHGFARDFEFQSTECGSSEVEFLLEATQDSFKFWPFCFELRVRYKIEETKLTISYIVKNVDRQDIYFSIGAHPAFETKDVGNYEIHFESQEAEFFKLAQGLINWKRPFELRERTFKLTPELFRDDALIFRKLKSKYIDLVDIKRHEVIRVYANTPYWGIWAKDKVPFVCLEPWYGVGDDVDHDKNIQTKKGIVTLAEGKKFEFSYVIETLSLEVE